MHFDVACGSLHEARFVDTMHHVFRHRTRRSVENGRLIHIVPEARYTHPGEVLIEAPPPFTRLRPREIRKNARARPDGAGVNAAVPIFHKMVASCSALVRRVSVTGEFSDMQVGYGNHVEVLRGKLRDHPQKVGKRITIDGERSVLLLEIDVQINNVGGNVIRSQTIRDFDHSRLRGVAVT